jgi:hypothetical protein
MHLHMVGKRSLVSQHGIYAMLCAEKARLGQLTADGLLYRPETKTTEARKEEEGGKERPLEASWS